MLLRLLPSPSASQAAPPTILFTLPLPANAYTAKALPLPPALMHHRNACLQESLECPNSLLGEKSSWISGIIDEVTFSAPHRTITVHFIDNTTHEMECTKECMKVLSEVVRQVGLSFSAIQATKVVPSSPKPTTESNKRGGPSTLLYSLLSPLLQSPATPSLPSTRTLAPTPTASPSTMSRVHRRTARSILVDAYRRFVLVALREKLPESYMAWTLQGELENSAEEWECLKSEVDGLLQKVGAKLNAPLQSIKRRSNMMSSAAARFRASSLSDASSASYSDAENSSSEDEAAPTTPATSIFSPYNSSSPAPITPLVHLSTLPPASFLPQQHRASYASAVSRLSALASRSSALRKTKAAMEREESRRKWMDGLEASRMAEKAGRRAWSNGASNGLNAGYMGMWRPIKGSSLWKCENARVALNKAERHPCMQSSEDEVEANCQSTHSERSSIVSIVSELDSDEEMDPFAENISVRPITVRFETQASSLSLGPPIILKGIPARPPLVFTTSFDSVSSSEDEELLTDVGSDSECSDPPFDNWKPVSGKPGLKASVQEENDDMEMDDDEEEEEHVEDGKHARSFGTGKIVGSSWKRQARRGIMVSRTVIRE